MSKAFETSVRTRNPHVGKAPVNKVSKFSKLSTNERIIAQWRAAHGCPLADEAKTRFAVKVAGCTFILADVRLWLQQHPERAACKESVFLEFFFDGGVDELGENGEQVFITAFEAMIKHELQESRVEEFRRRLATRRRQTDHSLEDFGESDTNINIADEMGWQSFLKTPMPATELSVRALRDAGCMIRFIVSQTSISISGAEIMGQACFHEYFPIDGIAQMAPESTMPLPKWVHYVLACGIFLLFFTLLAWWQVVKAVSAGRGPQQF